MKKLTNIALTLCTVLTACNSNTQEQTNSQTTQTTETKIDLPKTYYKKMKGTISDNLAVTMELTKTDSELTGTYFYNKIGLPLSVNGQVASSGEITLTETNEKYEETGKFVGKYSSPETFEGTWTNPKTNKSLPFKLTETKEGFANISFEHFRKENCATRDENKKKQASEGGLGIMDTMCPSIDVDLMKVSASNQTASDLINQSILKTTCNFGKENNSQYNSINELLNTVNSVEEMEEYFSTVKTNDYDILCISIGWSSYGGGAHPFNLSSYYNYDLKTGKEIGLEDILKPNYSDKLNHIAEKIFSDSYGTEGWSFEPGKFKLNENFAITTGGLQFEFNQYEMGAYAMGAPEVFIPYNKIKDLINQNGILTRMTQK